MLRCYHRRRAQRAGTVPSAGNSASLLGRSGSGWSRERIGLAACTRQPGPRVSVHRVLFSCWPVAPGPPVLFFLITAQSLNHRTTRRVVLTWYSRLHLYGTSTSTSYEYRNRSKTQGGARTNTQDQHTGHKPPQRRTQHSTTGNRGHHETEDRTRQPASAGAEHRARPSQHNHTQPRPVRARPGPRP